MTNIEAIAVLEDMKVKSYILNAAVTQKKRNEALEKAIRALANDEYTDAIMNEVMKKISVPTPSGYPVLPTVIEEMLHPGKPDDVQTLPKHLFTQRRFDTFSVCEFDIGGKNDG